MNKENKILIHSLKQGYVVTDYTSGEKYAVESPDGVIRIISKALGISKTEHDQEWTTEPVQITEPEIIKETLHPVPNILKQDILIQRFKYDHSLRKPISEYKNTWYAELPDGRVALGYRKASYYTTKKNVIKMIPYPISYGHFKMSGISTTAQTCLRAYRDHLGLQPEDCTQRPVTKGYLRPDLLSADKTLDYVLKSTQDRIKEAAERKTKTQDAKGELKPKKNEKTRALREMVIKMGIQ